MKKKSKNKKKINWAVISGIAITVIVALIGYMINRRLEKKELTVELLSTSMILNYDIPSSASELRFTYQDRDIPNLAISTVRVRNSGKKEIRSNDFEALLTIDLKDNEIISSKIISKNPEDLSVSTQNRNSSVIISKTLLNDGDEFTIEIISIPIKSENITVSSVEGRIAGIKKINYRESLPNPSYDSLPWPINYSIYILLYLLVFFFFYRTYVLKETKKIKEEMTTAKTKINILEQMVQREISKLENSFENISEALNVIYNKAKINPVTLEQMKEILINFQYIHEMPTEKRDDED